MITILDSHYDSMMHPTISPHPLYAAHTPDGDITLIPGTYTSEELDRVRDCIARAVVDHLPLKPLGLLYRKVNKYWFDWHSRVNDDEKMPPCPYKCLPHV